MPATELRAVNIALEQKSKGSPYSIAERRVLELVSVLGSQPAGDVSHKPGGRQLVINVRKSLPPKIVDLCSLCSFRRTEKLVDFSSFLTRFYYLVFLPVLLIFADVSADVRACVCVHGRLLVL